MNWRQRITRRMAQFGRDDSGSTLVEFAIVFMIFLALMFALIDFGRLAYNYVAADKAMQMAARIAAVRPAACPGVPEVVGRNAADEFDPNFEPSDFRFGASCSGANGTLCMPEADRNISCTGNPVDPDSTGDTIGPGSFSGEVALYDDTVREVYARIRPLLPRDARPENLRFHYTFDQRLNFLGGPYTPMVTVELTDLDFTFIHPLGGLLSLSGANSTFEDRLTLPFPNMSVSLPGEDLAQGTNG